MKPGIFSRRYIDIESIQPSKGTDLVDPDYLRSLDILVDNINQVLDPKMGVTSSQILSVLVLKEIITKSVHDRIAKFTESEKEQVKEKLGEFGDDIEGSLTELTTLYFIEHNPSLSQLQKITVSDEIEERSGITELIQKIIATDSNLQIIGETQEMGLEIQFTSLIERLSDKVIEPLLLSTLDLIREQHKFRGDGPGELELPEYAPYYPEEFTQDQEWMPEVVLMAKHTRVWLSQLSRKYEANIKTLDAIPLQELEKLANRGFTGLWLIGLWERSEASRLLKHTMGNTDAAASAYALWDYTIAEDLGGHEAYLKLTEKCQSAGLMLASDMVPNHTGIVSRWLLEHPDWFIQTSEPPFPGYSFEGSNISGNSEIEIYLEDGYYTHRDAAVVFKMVDHRDNRTRYIYHGNDGTSIPWNDTAQLDFLNSEVREAVIQLVLHVARMFPIIRLDAAMVLTKEHFQRLWYPKPGSGGDIPSRSRFGLSIQDFNSRFVQEFWREVVDRIAAERPNTLLVAEAFWMLEGYFVRTLGVHRVYNSAFMHMLRDQKNIEFRQLILSTLEYDPRILQRYVNFMSNPDEETAIEQFGSGDKYFGIAMLMVTLPGMPMFGHGQVEGYHEKYGMEYSKDYWNEIENSTLVELHTQLIFPLLSHRRLFAQVDEFRLYNPGHNDNIIAYSNADEDDTFLIIYNNSMEKTSSWIKEALFPKGLIGDLGQPGSFILFKNFYSDTYFLRTREEITDQGLFVALQGYQFQIFHKFTGLEATEDVKEIHQKYAGREIDRDRINHIIPDL